MGKAAAISAGSAINKVRDIILIILIIKKSHEKGNVLS
jgi:hypothetical protein